MFITRRVFITALSQTGLAALAGFSPLRAIADAMAQSAYDIAKPVSLPEMALGPANASVTITEYASMTCSHCAAFNANVFPKIKSEYIDTGKVRYVFREFPLDSKAAVASMLARCIAKDDAGKYFAVIDMMLRKLDEWSLPADPLLGFLRLRYPGMSEKSVNPVSGIRLYSTSYPPMKTSPTRCCRSMRRRPSSSMPRGSKAQSRSKSSTSGSSNCC